MIKPKLTKKIEKVSFLQEKFIQAKTVIVFEYTSLPVSAFMQLRRQLKKINCEVKVYPKNIMERAAVNAQYNDLIVFLKGLKALIISQQDFLEPIKIIYNFAKKNKTIKIIAGMVEKKLVSLQEINSLATLPSKEQILALLVVSMMAPLQQLAISLKMLLEKQEIKN
ncbi:50S ribosomal protein L10 ['Fragaria x ananassa' phyllody phytoplasma]|uniref:Large ribosomal subunit protein uL10 n=1 Tax='Fragaria x ananassa' phyllody phytoplasma TaxID=2358428 RepID=A0ABS5K3A6_9MOLU|nr:50S ribosomal protein L10 ['Fragaria x ananassa' phyllody phytoplasma]MBS2126357.1 50S ribosomal protein L10 ['Fragaria x ananassa' phyllody phytoplasma]